MHRRSVSAVADIDALAKAAEAVRKCIARWFCENCRWRRGVDCTQPACKIADLWNERVDDLARAVLEAIEEGERDA